MGAPAGGSRPLRPVALLRELPSGIRTGHLEVGEEAEPVARAATDLRSLRAAALLPELRRVLPAPGSWGGRGLIDTHAHVHTSSFDGDRDAVLARTWDSGGRYLIEVNIDPAGWPEVRRMARSDPRIYATLGVHPHSSGSVGPDDLEDLLGALDDPEISPRIVAIGETGLDYYRDYAPHDRQRDLFHRHVAAARETGLPLVVHARAAHDDVLRILREEGQGKVRGVLHCFSGDRAVADQARDLGFLLGFGGAITYNPKRSAPLLRDIGLDRIVLETDCPYMAPHPRRRERNEPANVPRIAAAVAEYLGIDRDEVERTTDGNAISLFGLPR
ncbi:MAG: YchF/TatD family DNA exonuclease [Candidatus Eisenbacteria bacterium]|nr:YchF/TatD family DNA exonuclease [Candidatus Latescibacterota bacterium]MBD3301553.1 YchF/TatD family DNA exonuclease [Candidatus Eisenbacteria bacterium]